MQELSIELLEYLPWLAFDRRALLTQLADKNEIKNFVRARVGEKYLSEFFSFWEPGLEIDWANLPSEFEAKVRMGSVKEE